MVAWMQRTVAVLFASLFVSIALAGCVGDIQRTEWAYDVTDIDGVPGTGARVRVAVLDTGINTAHPSLDHLVDGKAANGELIAFKDFMSSREGVSQAYDDDGHGSHVVGIMAARGGKSGGLLAGGFDLHGGSPGIQLMVARVCNQESCDSTAIRRAVDWSVSNGAHVISMSLGGVSTLLPFDDDDPIRASINNALDQGIVVVAAAGNGGPGAAEGERRSDVSFPADVPDVIAVGAISRDGSVASISSRGDNSCLIGQIGRCRDPDRKPELVAPGVGILSAWTGSDYVEATGTSQATPFVTSVVALLLEPRVGSDGKSPLRDRGDVETLKRVLVDTAKPVAGQSQPHDDAAGYGIVQAGAAFRAYGN